MTFIRSDVSQAVFERAVDCMALGFEMLRFEIEMLRCEMLGFEMLRFEMEMLRFPRTDFLQGLRSHSGSHCCLNCISLVSQQFHSI